MRGFLRRGSVERVQRDWRWWCWRSGVVGRGLSLGIVCRSVHCWLWLCSRTVAVAFGVCVYDDGKKKSEAVLDGSGLGGFDVCCLMA